VIEAEPHERIGKQAIALDRVVALLTDAVCALLHTVERQVHLLKELRQGMVLRIPHERTLETTFALREL
jgi:hypothetical protein